MSNIKKFSKLVKIKSIKKVGMNPSYDLIVEKNPNFILSNGILTHNTRQSQDCLRNLMETYSDNCFFILSCNDLNKIIEPIQSRCKIFNFDKPDKAEILERLKYICDQEKIKITDTDLTNIIDAYYPDIRKCVMFLQSGSIEGYSMFDPYTKAEEMKQLILEGNINKIYDIICYEDFDIIWFTKYFFKYIYNNFDNIGLDKCSKISLLLADILKSWQLNISLTEIFLANITEIIKILK